MEFFHKLLDVILHLSPQTVNALADYVGHGLYLVLFAIIFAETGLVVTPFLPGDSLLFAVGAVAAAPGSPINFTLMVVLLIVAAVIGDAVNYWIGYKLGPKVFSSEKSWLLNKKHLNEAQRFYDKHGGKTIIIARFVPIVRTFAPFVAGIGKMRYWWFAAYNVVGAVVWVATFLAAGYWFGSKEFVQKNFVHIIYVIVVISILPMAIGAGKNWLAQRRAPAATETPSDTAKVPM
jgi:membrane-associated protein